MAYNNLPCTTVQACDFIDCVEIGQSNVVGALIRPALISQCTIAKRPEGGLIMRQNNVMTSLILSQSTRVYVFRLLPCGEHGDKYTPTAKFLPVVCGDVWLSPPLGTTSLHTTASDRFIAVNPLPARKCKAML
jgi:hypothetical protein